MSDIHVIDGNLNGEYRVVMHFAVANANNSVGVNWRLALIRSGLASVSVLPDGDGTGGTISTTEKTQLVNGEVIEHVENVPTQIDMSNAQLTNSIRNSYAKKSAAVLEELQRRLKYYGHNEASV